MKHLPKDLKRVKKRLRAEHVIVRIINIALIIFSFVCVLAVIGYFASLCYVIAAFGHMGDGRNPLPPAKPKIRYARLDCVNDVRYMMRAKRFEACYSEPPPRGYTTYFYSYHDIKVTILQEYDYYPYYVFYGRVQLMKPDELPSPVKDTIPPERQTDFFLVNYFNSGAAKSYRGNGYHPEHYICHHLNFGFEHPQPGRK